MKQFHQNLLITLAICLCGLCAYQWYVESAQRLDIDKLEDTVAERNAALQTSSNTIKTADHEIAQIDAEMSGLKTTLKTNVQVIAVQAREIQRLQGENDTLTSHIDEYKKAVEALETKLKDSFNGIKKQNETIQQLVTQRDDLVSKLNASIKDRNEVVAKYNELVKRSETNQPVTGQHTSTDADGK